MTGTGPAGNLNDSGTDWFAPEVTHAVGDAPRSVVAGDFDGDANRDRTVDFADLLIVGQNYAQTGRTYSQGNIDYSPDGLVGFSDLLILAQRYGTTLIRTEPKSSAFGNRSISRRGLLEAGEALIV